MCLALQITLNKTGSIFFYVLPIFIKTSYPLSLLSIYFISYPRENRQNTYYILLCLTDTSCSINCSFLASLSSEILLWYFYGSLSSFYVCMSHLGDSSSASMFLLLLYVLLVFDQWSSVLLLLPEHHDMCSYKTAKLGNQCCDLTASLAVFFSVSVFSAFTAPV